jgi:hypothetical protein
MHAKLTRLVPHDCATYTGFPLHVDSKLNIVPLKSTEK